MRKLFLIVMTLIACTLGLNAQTVTYHGSVVDAANNEPLIGATIMPIGGGQGAAADLDGNFTITVPSTVKRAKVTYVGYKEETVDLHPDMRIRLTSTSQNLDDVVVVAYGTASKESLTGSVAVVGAKEIEDRPVTSVTAALEGNAPGVQVNNSVGSPGTAPTIRIRGFNSINGSNNPLYVVDGVPFSGSIADLNPADIESMSVLKDAASCALYGNRGANGVVLITTKRAKNVGKVDVTLQIRQGMYTRGLPFYDRLNANEWMQTAYTGWVNGLMSANPDQYPDLATAIPYANGQFLRDYAKNNIYGVGDTDLYDLNGKFVGGNPLPGYNDLDWWDAVSRTGYRQEYNLNAAAATDKFNVFTSIGYLKENGYMLDNDFQRFNGRINANYEPVSYLRIGANISATYQDSDSGGIEDTAAANNPFATMYYAPIYPYYQHEEDGTISMNAGQRVWNNATYLASNNVAQSMRLDWNNYSALVGDGMVYGTAVIPYGFELTVRGSMHKDKTVGSSYWNAQTGSGVTYNGMLRKTTTELSTYTFMQTLHWSHDYGNHNVDVLLDHENYSYNLDQYQTVATDQLFAGKHDFENFNQYQRPRQSIQDLRLESYLGRAKYNYDQKYFGEVSLRRDGSSRFAKNNRWGTFWSVGAGWIITKEKFMENADWLNYLKLRAAYGSVGNDASASAYSYWSMYAGVGYLNAPAYIPGNLATDNIKWEATKTFDIALEGSLFNDRFNFNVGYFNKRNSDLLFNVAMPLSIGTPLNSGSNSTMMQNIGTMQNIGWELQFGVDIIRNAELTWKFNIDATFMKNKIVDLPNGRDLPSQSLFIGKSIYEMYMIKWAGVDELTGQSLYCMPEDSPYYLRYNEDGSINYAQAHQLYQQDLADAAADNALYLIDGEYYTTRPVYARPTYNGTSIPTVYGSFGTSLSWKGLNVGLLFTYGLGGKTMDTNYLQLMNVGNNASAIHKDVLKSWTAAPAGLTDHRINSNMIPQVNTELAQYNYYTSSFALTSSNQLCLKNINISYDLPQKWVNPLKMQNINLGVSIDNVFLVTARKGMNPGESFAGGQSKYYVPARVFSFQIGARF